MATAATAVRACVPVAGRAPSRLSRSRRAARVAPRASHDDEAPMDVPEDAFRDAQGHPVTPERKAALALGNLFTMAATRVILDQFTGTRHRSPVYNKMVDFLAANPLRDGNEWLAKLMRDPDNDLRVTALRIIETRRVFAETEFNWEICQRVATEETEEDTLEITRAFLTSTLSAGPAEEVRANAQRGGSSSSSW